jgi:hypothetical protein
MCNHPQDAQMHVDQTFRIQFKPDNGAWHVPVLLHQYNNRVQLARTSELRSAILPEQIHVRVCAYKGGMSFGG